MRHRICKQKRFFVILGFLSQNIRVFCKFCAICVSHTDITFGRKFCLADADILVFMDFSYDPQKKSISLTSDGIFAAFPVACVFILIFYPVSKSF